ncbi:MFS transporter [Actinoallomurus bryophytorum]|uniref:Putative MFS family arabinose efflux permease n=1 Tax=Actinoallomurus bryophytorum TaxID=1490222 RepID=A0A543CI18_9ACTN|nr:MFS transporter [Actinoallomurus bryophytorum]TQL96753.1 putative MFS family arabinose efflux permease [Actinoallomurus bryophytorum]
MTHSPTVSAIEPAPYRETLWQRDFKLLWGGSAVSLLGSMSATVACPLLALALTGSPIDAGRLAAAATLPGLLLLLPAGVVVDRLDRRRIMLVSQSLRGTVGIVLAISVAAGAPSILLLTIAAAVGGICMTFYNVAEVSAIPKIVLPEDLADAVAKNEARSHVALLLGRPLGGLLYSFGRFLPFAVDAVSCFVSVGALKHMRAEPFRPDPDTRRRGVTALAGELKEGLARLWTDRLLRTALTVCTVTNFFFQAVVVLLVVLGRQQQLSTILIGTLLAAPGLGGVIGTVYAQAELKEKSLMAVTIRCAWSWALLIGLVAVSSNPLIWLFGWGGVGYMGARMNIALDTYQARAVPYELLGRVAGANRFLSLGAVPFGTFCGGYAIAAFGARRTAIAIAGLIGVLAVIVTSFTLIGRPRSPRGARSG